MPKLMIVPDFDTVDTGDGGIRRVVEAQKKYLPEFGYEVLSSDGNNFELNKGKIDLVSTHGVFQAEIPGIPTVNHSHGMYWSDYEWDKWAYKANEDVIQAFRKAHISTAPSEWVARIMRRGMWLEAPVLYHGVEPKEWKVGSKTKPYVLWNKTRIDPVCEVETLNVLARMADNVEFITTVGTNATKDIPNITFTGRLPFSEAKRYVQDASVYLCNTRETFGIGTLEAMLCEVPILGWNWGGQREIVEHKVTGWLATPGDFDSLHNGLIYCLENRERLGKAGRAYVIKNFTWKRAIQRYAELYDRVLREHKAQLAAPKVSVIITCYNLADVLPRAVASVVAQDMQDWEIVIVNDASPDSTAEVAAKLSAGSDRIRVVTNSSNLYLAGSLNVGISSSRGRYIVPLDADNELSPNALGVLSSALDGDSRLGISYGGMEVVEPNGSRWVSDWPPTNFSFEGQVSHKNQITSTAMYRRSVWERVGGYRRRCRTAEDADFWCRATSYGAIPRKVTEAPMLIYHNRDDSMSRVEKDWAWHEWYPWNKEKNRELTPFGAAVEGGVGVPTYEPVKITVVIPVGPGHGKFVVDAIDSLCAQTYGRWDVIVVNDSGEKLDWIHPFVKVIDSGGRKGPAIARNLGIKAAQTQFFLPLDADDYLQPETLASLLSVWEKGTYVYSDFVVQETGEVKQLAEWNCQELVKSLPHAVTALYEKEMWEAVGGFDESIKGWEDWDFALALASKGYCGKRVPLPLFNYRMHSGSRREDILAGKTEYVAEISRKWHKYVIDGEPLMACGGCGQKRAVATPVVQQVGQQAFQALDGLVLVEYTGNAPPRTWRGPNTGNLYRFGNDEGHKVKYVDQKDVTFFTTRASEFKEYNNSGLQPVGAILEAAGPPVRV